MKSKIKHVISILFIVVMLGPQPALSAAAETFRLITTEAFKLNSASTEKIQKGLKALGYHIVKIDGKFGAQTSLAVTKFQLNNRFTMTGYPDASFRKAFNKKLKGLKAK